MTVLEEFYETYLHYTVAYRLWQDTCRQLRDCRGTVDERQQIVDETLRLAMCVSDNIDDTESLIADTLEFIQTAGIDNPDLLQAISYITNNLKEDRARADSYTKFITNTRIGNKPRKPRKPQIANPFVPIVGDEYEVDEREEEENNQGTPETESETPVSEEPASESEVPEEDAAPEDGAPQEDHHEHAEENQDGEPAERDDTREETPEAREEPADDETEKPAEESPQEEESPSETEEPESDNPLRDESERMAEEHAATPQDQDDAPEPKPKKKKFPFGRRRSEDD